MNDETPSGCGSGCVFVLAGLSLLLSAAYFDIPRLSAFLKIVLALLVLGRLVPGLPPRWFGPSVSRSTDAREFWILLAAGSLCLVGAAAQLLGAFGAR